MRKLTRVIFRGCSFFKPVNGSDPTFQSQYYRPKVPVSEFLRKHNLDFKQTNTGFKMRECVFCHKPHNNDPTNMYTLNIQKDSGVFHCFRCSSKGSWMHFRGRVLGVENLEHQQYGRNRLSNQENAQGWSLEEGDDGRMAPLSEMEYIPLHQNLKKEEFAEVKEYLIKQRGLSEETIEKYKIGADIETFTDMLDKVSVKSIIFPMFRKQSEKERKKYEEEMLAYLQVRYEGIEDFERVKENTQASRINTNTAAIVKCKVRGSGSENKRFMRQFPNGPAAGFFGFNLINKDTKQVVITEGEFDAMSVYQQTGIPALSLPQGATHLPDHLLPYLEQFQKIILWMDNDEAGRLNCPKIAYKLGEKRTYIVNNPDPQLKDANDYLRSEKRSQIPLLVKSAKTIPSTNLLKFENLREAVMNRIMHFEQYMGIQSTWFRFFNKKIKGLRMNEVTIVSGGTGSGKTTLLSQLTLDLCKRGVSTLWGSFEIKNDVLATTMLHQFSQCNLAKHPDRLDYFCEQFVKLPLYYLSFHGSTDLEKVFGTIQYSIQKYDISHIVIDTLQFLLSGQAVGFEKFDLQDKVMARLRRLSTDYNVHVTVVIHPRKTQDGEDLGLHSIFGSTKSVQEADNVWIIQNRPGFKVFEVKKNRFDGELGKVALGFMKGTKEFFQLRMEELERIFKNTATIEQIVEERLQSEIKINSEKKSKEEADDLREAIFGSAERESEEMMSRKPQRNSRNNNTGFNRN